MALITGVILSADGNGKIKQGEKVVGAVSTCISVRGIAKWIVKSATTIARTVLGWGPMAQAGVAYFTNFREQR